MKCDDCKRIISKLNGGFPLCTVCHRKFEKKWISQSFAYAEKHKQKA